MDKISVLEKGIIVGAYTSSPTLYNWNVSLEKEFLENIKNMDKVRGLEIPFWGESLHPNNTNFFLSMLNHDWEHVITCIPGTMKRLENEPEFGLASINEKNRKNAIEFVNLARLSTEKLVKHIDKNCVIAVQLTSSPKTLPESIKGNADKLYASLSEICSWDWYGAKIVIEHCDSFTEQNMAPQKGFLSLNEEIQVIKSIIKEKNSKIGLTVNWGRSAIEGKNIKTPEEHVKSTYICDVLSGIIFSGVTDNPESLHGAWKDSHAPPAKDFDILNYESTSLMTFKNIKNTLNSCNVNNIDYIGIKLMPLPAELTISNRIGINKDAIKLISKALNEDS